MFKLEFKTDNDDFSGHRPEYMVSEVLRIIADRLDRREVQGPVRDFNGNTIGHFELTED